MYFEYRTLDNFTKKDFDDIKFFTYKDGMARPIFEDATNLKLLHADKHYLVMLRHELKFLIGWSLIYPKFSILDKAVSYMCFVRPLFRKKGLGRKLFEETMSKFNQDKQIVVYGWDDRSKEFYSKLQAENLEKKKIDII